MDSQSLPDLIRRLITIDAALASRDGLHVGEAATQWAVSQKTIRRDLQLLAELVGPTVCEMESADNTPGRTWRHRYVDRRRRLFAQQ